MTKEQLFNFVNHGREIEFIYKNKKYSITYSPEGVDDFISFCEFYKEPTNVKTVEELLHVTQNGVSVLQMLESLNEDDVWIY